MSRPIQPFRKVQAEKKEAGDFRPRMGTKEPKKGERGPKGSSAAESAKSSRGGEILSAEKPNPQRPRMGRLVEIPTVEIPRASPEFSTLSDTSNSDTSRGNPSPETVTPEPLDPVTTEPATEGAETEPLDTTVAVKRGRGRPPLPKPDFLLPAEDASPGPGIVLPASPAIPVIAEKEPQTQGETGTQPS